MDVDVVLRGLEDSKLDFETQSILTGLTHASPDSSAFSFQEETMASLSMAEGDGLFPTFFDLLDEDLYGSSIHETSKPATEAFEFNLDSFVEPHRFLS